MIDRLFGTYYLPGNKWPETMGLSDSSFPDGYVKQFLEDQPQAKVSGHNIFSDKTCPNFNVSGLMLLAGIPGNRLITDFAG